jgi:oxaloacetate decarboxylase alpha subunit
MAVPRRVELLDTTLRDAHQCLWATRMSTAHMLPVASTLDRCGFVAAELMGLAHFDAAVRFLKEDPFERIRLMSAAMPRTPLQALVRSRCLRSFNPLPDDVNCLFVERMIANGIRRITGFDGLHDWSNIAAPLRLARDVGASVGAWLIYTLAPGYDDDFYAAKAREVVTVLAPDAIVIEDPSGLLTPDRTRTLVPAVRAAIGTTTLEFHTHCLTGLGPLVTLEAARAGADVVTTSIAPLANGNAPPSAQAVARNLGGYGLSCEVDLEAIESVGRHFAAVAEREGFPTGAPVECDLLHYRHQMAGGVLSNLVSQLREVGAEARLPEVIEECVRVREELGWPIIVTPFAQFVATQAAMNVLQGQRYRFVPDEVKKYALGYFGRLRWPVDPDVLDRIVENGSPDVALQPPPLEPALPQLRRRYPHAGDDERLLRYLFADEHVDAMVAAQPKSHEFSVVHPLVELLSQLQRRQLARVAVHGRGFSIRISAQASPSGESGS